MLRLRFVVDQHHGKLARNSGLERRLEEVDVHAERFERFAHVVGKGWVEPESRHIREVVGGVHTRIAAREIDEVNNACELSVGAPEFGFCSEQVGVHVEPLARGDVCTHKLCIDVFGQQRRRTVTVEPKPAVFVDQIRRFGFVDEWSCAMARANIWDACLGGKVGQGEILSV